MFKMQIAELEF